MEELYWDLSNPAVALEQYYDNTAKFRETSEDRKRLEKELSKCKSSLSSKQSELDDNSRSLSAMGSYEQGDSEQAVLDAQNEAQRKINEEKKRLETKQKELSVQRDHDIDDNDRWLSDRLEQLLGDSDEDHRELTEAEKKALEFESSRRQFITESDKKINEYEDIITEEQLSCETEVGELKGKQDAVRSKYEPGISESKGIIDSITSKYQPDIQDCQEALDSAKYNRETEIGGLQQDEDEADREAGEKIDNIEQEFKWREKDLQEQIRSANRQNKSTYRLESSLRSSRNKANEKIQKINNNLNKKISAIENKIEKAEARHEKIIDKAQTRLDDVVDRRDQELEEPTERYNGLVKERDSQLESLQSEIDQRENDCNLRISQNKALIESQKSAQAENNAAIDRQIIDFAMSQDNCFSDVLDEQNAPFAALAGRVNTWMELLSSIKKDKMTQIYPTEHERQKNMLTAMDYSQLQSVLTEANQFNDQLNTFAANAKGFTIAGGILALFGTAVFLIFDIMFSDPAGLTGIVLIVMGAVLAVMAKIRSDKAFTQICRYVSLACDYKGFPAITARSTEITQQRELAHMKEVGSKLYDIHYGKIEAQDLHDAKDKDIRVDYERNLKLANKEYENAKAQIERERDAQIGVIRDNAYEGQKKFNNDKAALENQEKKLKRDIAELNQDIDDKTNELDADIRFMDDFEKIYSNFKDDLDNSSWTVSENDTKDNLSNTLYIVPDDKKDDDGYGHKNILEYDHHKKAFVVNYDIDDIDAEDLSSIRVRVKKLMIDLMYAFYRMNNKEIYDQYVVGGTVVPSDLKSEGMKNTFNIREVVRKVEDLRDQLKEFKKRSDRFAEKNTTIDDVNQENFRSGDRRPEKYNILYMVFDPGEKGTRLNEDVKALIPDCEKYGFLPVFVCEKATWDSESSKDGTTYHEIKVMSNSEVVVYDGRKYAKG